MKYTILIEQDESMLVSEVVELPECHTQAKTLDDLISRTEEAIRAYLKDDSEAQTAMKFIGIQQIEV